MTLKLAALPDTFAEFITEYHKLLIAKFKAEAKNSNHLELDSYDFLLDAFAERCGIPPASMIAYSKSLAYPHPKTIVKIEAVYDGHSLAQYYPRPKGFTVTAQNAKRAEYVARRPAVSKEPGKVKVEPKAEWSKYRGIDGKMVRNRRLALKLTTHAFSQMCEVPAATLIKVEAGTPTPNTDAVLARAANVFQDLRLTTPLDSVIWPVTQTSKMPELVFPGAAIVAPKQALLTRTGDRIRDRRVALGLSLRDLAEGAGVDMRLLRRVESGRVCAQKERVTLKVEQYLTKFKAEQHQAPHGTIAKNEAGGWGWINSTSIPAGQTMTFRILPADGVKFTPEELAAFPAFRPEPKPYLGFELPPTVKEAIKSMEQVEFVPTNQTWATQAQLEAFADELGQSILQSGLNFRTWTWATFHAALFELTGCGMFNHDLLASCLSNSVLGGRVEFLISYGNNSVFVCKDANFAPVEID